MYLSRICLAVVLLPTLGGCVSEPTPTAADLTAFEAHLHVAGFDLMYRFDGPVEVRDSIGVLRQAYRLTEQNPGDVRPDRVLFLDGTLHVVRVDRPCASPAEDDCTRYHAADFSFAGQVPPHGIAWAAMAAAGHLTADTGGRRVPVPHAWDGHTLEVTAANETVAAAAVYPGAFRYVAGLVPTDGPTLELIAYQERAPLPQIAAWPLLPVHVASGEGRLFPGSHQDLLRIGVSPDVIVEHLEQQRADLMPEGSCFAYLRVDGPAHEPDALQELIDPARRSGVLHVQDGDAQWIHDFTITYGRQGPELRMDRSRSAPASDTCDDRQRSPPPAADSRLLDEVENWSSSSPRTAATIEVVRRGPRLPEAGWHAMSVYLLPPEPEGSFYDHRVTFDLHRSTVLFVQSAPSDFEAEASSQ